MFNFLRESILNLLYGERFEVTTKDAKLWIEVDNALTGFPNKSIPTTILTGNDFAVVIMELQPQQCWADVETLEGGVNNIIIPDIVFHFLKNGGTLDEIHNYKIVMKYGMLHGKKRRLVII